ncbi:MAG: DUF1573 domain-containing protein [Bacteroidales bacterium]|jgi:hypothetical protein|nr:DUF1573 domain-containing protein [Bacteroidales bacterium]
MKKVISLALIFLISILAFAQKQGAVISWDKMSYDFGTIKKESGVVKYKFIFVNVGDEPLLLEKVKSTCGCSTSNYTKDAVAPNAKGFVEIMFDPVNQSGEFLKKITVITNEKALGSTNLEIKGNVISEKKD